MNSKPRSQRSADGPSQSLRVRKSTRRKRLNRRSVLAAMEMMTDKTPDSALDPVQEFLTTGRTGRRNALPDILGEHAATSTGDLPDCMQKLNTSEGTATTPTEPEASTSGVAGAGTAAGTGSTKPQTPPEQPPKKDPKTANS